MIPVGQIRTLYFTGKWHGNNFNIKNEKNSGWGGVLSKPSNILLSLLCIVIVLIRHSKDRVYGKCVCTNSLGQFKNYSRGENEIKELKYLGNYIYIYIYITNYSQYKFLYDKENHSQFYRTYRPNLLNQESGILYFQHPTAIRDDSYK